MDFWWRYLKNIWFCISESDEAWWIGTWPQTPLQLSVRLSTLPPVGSWKIERDILVTVFSNTQNIDSPAPEELRLRNYSILIQEKNIFMFIRQIYISFQLFKSWGWLVVEIFLDLSKIFKHPVVHSHAVNWRAMWNSNQTDSVNVYLDSDIRRLRRIY